jgi:23S rRNA (adenine2503-C2)-methyltransferase
MSDISKALRAKLEEKCFITKPEILRKQVSQLDGTIKYLFGLSDGNSIETVLMKYEHGNSICLSTQAGCKMGCVFCASFDPAKSRNLTPAEILDEILFAQKDSGRKVSNIVLMGTGEPLDNTEEVIGFIRLLADPDGQNMSMRNITLSTCGIVPGIYRLAEEKMPITLALSLHAPTQEKREKLMPIARRYHLDEVMRACDNYREATGRRETFEYALVAGVNDTDEDVRELAQLLKGRSAHVNLIPVNPVRTSKARRPERRHVLEFQKKLEKSGINGTIRREMGADIDGACGQLRRRQ